jgi:hypothetical protein
VYEWEPLTTAQVSQNSDVGYVTLRQSPDTGNLRIVSEYREKDVLGGISQAGGLWTVLNALCVLIFGSNLLWLNFGKFFL